MNISNLIPFKNQLRLIKNKLKRSDYLRFPHHKGYCPICEKKVVFYKEDKWLRDFYKCNCCGSIPRNRALVNALNNFFPKWREVSLHESSPGDPLSKFLKKSASNYSASYYFEDVERGHYKDGYRSEDLSALTLESESLDIFITSDVFEHIVKPEQAFREIARVLKPGGAHVFTMPWYKEIDISIQRAALENGEIVNLLEPVYHGNPISIEGSLVTYDWGKDFCDVIYKASGMFTTIYLEKNKRLGLDAEFLEVFISRKPNI
jgi:SAM-dependent methyltransferase